MTQNDDKQKLGSLIDSFDTAMLVTRASDGELRSRPMRVVARRPDDTLVFVTHRMDGKLDEILGDPAVNLSMQDGKRFVSVSGRATIDTDADRIGTYYEASWRIWFPDGPRDRNIALIDVAPSAAEFWDGSGWNGITYAFEALKAAAKGEKIDSEKAGEHAKVDLE